MELFTLLRKQALENKNFDECCHETDEYAGESGDCAVFDTSDSTEKSNKASCAEYGLFDLDGCGASKQRYNCAYGGNELVACVGRGECCGSGVAY